MKILLKESQYDRIFINEDDNPAYQRSNANSDNLKAIWAVIDKKQQNLQKIVFGDLGDKLYDIASEKAKQMGEEFAEVPHNMCNAGNKKLPMGVLFINMSSALMCPSYYLGICTITNGRCYAQSEENRYSNTAMPVRWKTDIMYTQMLQQYQHGDKNPMKEYFRLIETYIQLGNAYSENVFRKEMEKMEYKLKRSLTKEEKEFLRIQNSDYKITDIRLNETGDFQCQLAVDLWDKFAEKIKRKYGINTHAYTARNLDFSNVKNIAINPSHKGINLGENLPRMFKAISDKEYNRLKGGDKVIDRQPELAIKEDGTYYYKCPCGKGETKCDRCGVCFDKNKTGKPYTIFVKYHGMEYANGLKSLFTKDEVQNVIEKMYKNGWVTDEEYDKYTSNGNQTRLKNISKNINNMRKETKKKKKQKK